jgi:hypothetical protein
MPPQARSVVILAAVAVAPLLTSCYTPAGGIMTGSNRAYVYISTPTRPTTITVMDTCTNQPFFHYAIPPGKQLTFRFVEGGGDHPRERPDKMIWEVADAPMKYGSLSNQLTCPAAWCRRIDVSFRPGPEPLPTNPGELVPPAQGVVDPENEAQPTKKDRPQD